MINLCFRIYRSENDEYTCDAYYGKDSELKCVVPRKRIEVRDGEVKEN
jgi:carbamoyl-phosphate synthase large subunit